MEVEFRKSHFVEGLVNAIEKAANSLAKHFPISGSDSNELSDDISVGNI